MLLFGQVLGEGPPIVVLPWLGVDHAVMASACEPALSRQEHWSRLYLDLPGTGKSPLVGTSSDDVLDAVRQTIDATLARGERFALVGCSYGGYLAAGLARRIPDRVIGLLAVCAGVRARLQDRDLSGLSPPTPQQGWLGDVPRELHDFCTHEIGHQTATVANRVARALALGGPSNERYLADLRNRFRLADEDRGGAYPGPATLMAGRKDRVAGYRDQFAALARYPRGTYLAHADAGHFLPFEQPTFFASVTRSWLATCVSAS